MKRIINLLYFVACFIASCTQPNSDMLVGSYCLNRYCGRDSLTLYKNNKYKHKLYFFNGRIVEDFGTWQLDSIRSSVSFENFVFYNDDGSKSMAGLWTSNVELLKEKEVRLMYSNDQGLYYSKN